jgi:hypothetical protein
VTGAIQCRLDGADLGSPLSLPATGAYGTYARSQIGTLALPKGTHTLELRIVKGGFNLDLLRFQQSVPVSLDRIPDKHHPHSDPLHFWNLQGRIVP